MATGKGESASANQRTHRLSEMGWNEIDGPGAYPFVRSGDLVRVPVEALAPGHSPLMSITSNGETRVAKLSENPAVPITVLRNIAADNDYFVNF